MLLRELIKLVLDIDETSGCQEPHEPTMDESYYPLDYNSRPWDHAEPWLQDAHVYLDAVNALLKWLQETRPFHHDYQILPVLFLFRHYIELQLKGLILHAGGAIPSKEHDLLKLLKILEPFDQECLHTTPGIIRQLSSLDRKSVVFRYPIDTKGIRHFGSSKNPPLYHKLTKLSSLIGIIQTVSRELENLEGYYDALREYEQESRSNI